MKRLGRYTGFTLMGIGIPIAFVGAIIAAGGEWLRLTCEDHR